MEILIVEDDYISRSLLKKMLVEMGNTVIEAENGDQAWEILQTKQIKIVVSDWIMPGLNGLNLCRKIRSESYKYYVYVIILTAKDSKTDLVDVFSAGADDYIPKPFDPEELRARVMTGVRVIDLEDRHKKLANTLIESRNKLRIVLDSLTEEIISVDQNKQIVSVNKAFAGQMKTSPQSVVGKNCFTEECCQATFLSDKSIQDDIDKVFKTGESIKKLFTTHYDEKVDYKKISCVPIRNEFDEVFQVVIVSQDITEEKRRTEEIQSLNDQLISKSAEIETQNSELKQTLKRLEDTQAQMLQSEKMASIGQLAAGVAHEINNPTGFVSSNLKTLLDYQNDITRVIEKYHELRAELEGNQNETLSTQVVKGRLATIKALESDIDIDFLMEDITDLIGDCREGMDRIKKIVTDLKDFAHPGEDKVQMLDINRGLESTLNVVNNELKYKASVTRELGELPQIKGYPQQLNQVFMNILVNAAQAIERKGEITVRTRLVDDQIKIEISDTGCGIPKENLQKIFDPFFTTKDVGKGTGLGMNIAYNIVKKHNGMIQVDSIVGKGTLFTINIPVETFPDSEAVSCD